MKRVGRSIAVVLALWVPAGSAWAAEADAFLDQLVADWPADDPMTLRLRLSSEPIVEAMILWDAAGNRVFPPDGAVLHVTEEAMVADIPRLDALRASADGPVWEIVSRNANSYYQCEPLRCLRVNGPALASALGQDPRSHNFGGTNDNQMVFLILALAVLGAAAVVLFRPGGEGTADAADPDAFPFGPVTVNPGLRTVSDADGTRDLTERDLKLITCFRDNPRFVLSKDDLYDAGWGRDYMPNSRALDQHILTLRRKIDPDQKRGEVIETVRGQGYRYNG